MEHSVAYNITAIDKITPVYSRLIALSQKLTGNNAAIKSTTEGVGTSVNKLTEAAVKTQGVINNNATQIANSAAGITKLNQAYERMSSLGIQRFGRVKKSATKTNAEIAKQLPILDRLRNKLASYERRALGAGNSIKKGFGSVVSYLGPVGTTIGGIFAFSQIKQVFDQTTNAASDLNESANKAKEIFGNSFSSIKSFSDGAAKSIGMSKAQALGAASSFGQLFGNLGFGEQKTAKFSESTVRLAADLASFNNMNMDESLQALMATLKGETEPAMRFGVLLNDMTVKQKAFDMGLIKSTKEAMTPAIKTQAIYGLVLEQTKKAQGDFSRTSEDVANKTRILQAAQVDLQAKIGQGLLPMKLKLVNVMISAVDWISKNSEKLMSWGQTALWVGGAFLSLYATAKTILGIASYYNTVKKAITTVRNSTVLATIAQGIFNGVAALNPFVWVIAAVAGGYLLIKNWDKVKVWFSKMFNWVKDKFLKFGDWIAPIWTKTKAWFSKIFGFIRDQFLKLAKFIISIHPLTLLINLVDKIFPGFKQKLMDVFGWIKDQFSKLGQWIYDNVIGRIAKFFKSAATEYSKDFQPKVKQPEFAKPFQFDAVARIQTAAGFTSMTNFLKAPSNTNKADGANDSYYDGILNELNAGGSKGPGDKSKDKTSSVGDSVSGLVQAGGKEVKNITIRIENIVKQMDFNVTKTIRDTSGQMKEEVVKALLTAVNDVNYQ